MNTVSKTVMHYVQYYLGNTNTWLYGQIRHAVDWRHCIVTTKIENFDRFPFDPLYCTRKLAPALKLYNTVFNRLVGYYPLFLDAAKRERPLLIHGHFGQIGYKALGLAGKIGVPLVTTFYGRDVSRLAQREKYRRRYRVLFAGGDLFLAEGTAMKRALGALGCPEEKMRVFHLGVDVDAYPFEVRKAPSSGPIVVLFAGTFTEKKGLTYAIRAFAQAVKTHGNTVMRIIGDGEDRPAVERLIADLGIGPLVEMLGFVDYARLIEEMMRAHIFIHPSVTAADGNTEGGAPVTIIDAEATGLPVASTFHADIPEVVLHEKTGLLSPEKDVDALVRNLSFLLDNPAAWASMGAAAHRHVQENYNIRTQGILLGKIYDAVVADHARDATKGSQ